MVKKVYLIMRKAVICRDVKIVRFVAYVQYASQRSSNVMQDIQSLNLRQAELPMYYGNVISSKGSFKRARGKRYRITAAVL